MCSDKQMLTQDQLKKGLRLYLHIIKQDAQSYINNENINFGDQNDWFESETQDIYMQAEGEKFEAPEGSRISLALKVVSQL